jgi:succinyl-diaminopimelate desuccinylase
MGDNAIHRAGLLLDHLREYRAARVVIDGLEYREGLNAVGIRGGIAGNVIPDECVVTVNYRFAPDKTPNDAAAHLAEFIAELPDLAIGMQIVDSVPGALPGLSLPVASEFIAAVGAEPKAKFGWTDVARFSALGIPAVNFGPGDPSLAHASDERVPISDLTDCLDTLRRWLA